MFAMQGKIKIVNLFRTGQLFIALLNSATKCIIEGQSYNITFSGLLKNGDG